MEQAFSQKIVIRHFIGSKNPSDPEDPERSLMEMTIKNIENTPSIFLLAPGDDELLKFKYRGDLESFDDVKKNF